MNSATQDPDTESPPHGHRVEETVRAVAARLGIADFVFVPFNVRKGQSGLREVGDGLVIAGGRGAILQVKSRLPSAAASDSPAQVKRWLSKEAERAYRQGLGTKRSLLTHIEAGDPLIAYPVRTLNLSDDVREHFKFPLDDNPSDWPIVVVLDHPNADGIEAPNQPDGFYITLGDWHELNRAIRSIGGLLEYFSRALDPVNELSVPLGHELERFAAFVEADSLVIGSSERTRPWLSFDALTDPEGADLYRVLLEYVWPQNSSLPQVAASGYRTIVEFLDSVPPGSQAELGRWVLKKRRELKETGHRSSGAWLTEKKLFVYFCDSAANEPDLDLFLAELAGLCTLRNTELSEQLNEFIPTLGIGARTDNDGIDYRYFFMGESLPFPPGLRRSFEWRYGCFSYRQGKASIPKIGRNESCPCGSKRKYKVCHGRR